jgi:hypothetical protein
MEVQTIALAPILGWWRLLRVEEVDPDQADGSDSDFQIVCAKACDADAVSMLWLTPSTSDTYRAVEIGFPGASMGNIDSQMASTTHA